MTPALKASLLLIGSNIFMTFAWYAHLKNLRAKPLIIAIAVSWGIALFEETREEQREENRELRRELRHERAWHVV